MKQGVWTAASGLAISLAITAAAVADPLAPIGVGAPPPPPPKTPVTETLWGVPVTDDWRGLEAMGPATKAWMRSQGEYTRKVLDAIGPLAALQKRVAAFSASFGFVSDYSRFGGRSFYEERAPGSDNFDLMVRDADGATRKLVDVAALRASHGGRPYAINYIEPSPDGTKVAVGVSEGGSEDAKLAVYDAATGAVLAGPLDRARFGVSSWSNDSRSLFLLRNKALTPGEPATDFERFVTVANWDFMSAPVPLGGAGSGRGPAVSPDEFPYIALDPTAPEAIFAIRQGVRNEVALFTAPAAEATSPSAHWSPLTRFEDGVTDLQLRGDRIYLLSHKGAPTFQVLVLKAGEPLSAARVILPSRPDRVIESIHAAKDGLYVATLDGVYSHLLKITDDGQAHEIALPARGHIGGFFTDPRQDGATLELSSWVLQPTRYRYDPADGAFVNLHLGAPGRIAAGDYTVEDLEATAKDGVKVPLSLVLPRHPAAPGKAITVIEAYGSYGISNLADFSPRRAAFMQEGLAYGVCHVRGGGELGDAWRLAGKDANKPNTWRDLIACAQDLVNRGVTDPSRLFILGGSAGGITMGRAMEERPDLFAGVLDLVPASNLLRMEFTPNGPPNVPEFGTIKTETGFHNLYAMDSVMHVKSGVAYPPILISTGLNDPRVAPWQPAKLAAALDAADDPNPVLLRIDPDAGHGIGSTRSQGDSLNADQIAFIFWRAGLPDWRPDAVRSEPSH